MHIGYELVRSPFDWRMDQGAWQTVTPTDYTIDVQEIGGLGRSAVLVGAQQRKI